MRGDKRLGWADDHDDDHEGANTEDEAFWTPPHNATPAPFVRRIAIMGSASFAHDIMMQLLIEGVAAGIAPLFVVKNGQRDESRVLSHSFSDRLDPSCTVSVAYDDQSETAATAAFLRAVMIAHEARFPDAAVLLLIAPGEAAAVSHALVHYLVVCGNTVADALALRRDADLLVVLEAAPETTGVPHGTSVFSIRDAPNPANDLFTLLQDAVFGGDD